MNSHTTSPPLKSLSATRSALPEPPGPKTTWRAELGAHWTRWIPLGLLLLFGMGASIPLADPDFPMHLATGQWIAQHHQVPFNEPFAWTRANSPYYAYSWLPELVYYLLYSHLGSFALRALHGLTIAAGGASLLWLARISGWRAWTALYLIVLSIFPEIFVAAFVRPQALLFPLIILAWGCGLRILESDNPLPWCGAACVVAAAAANSHLLFPLTGLPCAIALARSPVPWRRGALLAMALVVGWMASPYALHWVDVFRLNFGHNAMFDFPSPITEFIPGFRFASGSAALALFTAMLAITPFALRTSDATTQERVVFGALWLVGLFGFGLAARALMVWWFATLPLLAHALNRWPTPRPAVRRVLLATMSCLPLLLALRFLRVGRALGDGVASPARPSVEPLARWLDENAKPEARVRVMTIFYYGSYLTWRLPGYSMSTDGRTIFPDSASAPDSYRIADAGPTPLGPWRSSDLAIVPLHHPVATVLDTASEWIRVETVAAAPLVPWATGLWVRRSWRIANRR